MTCCRGLGDRATFSRPLVARRAQTSMKRAVLLSLRQPLPVSVPFKQGPRASGTQMAIALVRLLAKIGRGTSRLQGPLGETRREFTGRSIRESRWGNCDSLHASSGSKATVTTLPQQA